MNTKRTFLIFMTLMTLIMSSCTKEFVNVQNKNQIPYDQYWNKPEHAWPTLVAVYAMLKYSGISGVNYFVTFHGMDPVITNEGQGYVTYQNMTFLASDGNVEGIYRHLYSGLNRANIAIEKIPLCGITDTNLLNTYLGEAYFLRAFFSYRLTTLFNAPPLLNRVLDPDEYKKLGNTPQEQWFDFIKEDCKKAIARLPEKWDDGNLGRATKGAAWALLGKTYMEDEVWDSAEWAFNKLIVDKVGNYDLIKPQGTDSIDYVYAYLCNYTLADLKYGSKTYRAENNQESIFEVQNTENDPKMWNMWLNGYGCDGSLYTTYFSIVGYWNIGVAQSFVNEYEKVVPSPTMPLHRDPRLYATVYLSGDTIKCFGSNAKYCNKTIDETTKLSKSAWNPPGYSLKKYLFPMYPYATADGKDDPTNIRLITYSEVLLNQAEVKYQLNKDGEALDLINEIRNRVGLPDTTTTDVKSLLLHEYKIEKAAEGKWMVEVMRWARTKDQRTGEATFVNPVSIKTGFVPGKHEYLPIPQYEIDYMTQGNLQQNPGW